MFRRLIRYLFILIFAVQLQAQQKKVFWETNKQLTPFRLPLPLLNEEINYIDLDDDGDPDVLQTKINGTIPIQWIDDDDDMKKGDIEGDMDSDCLMIDRNIDGLYGSEHDLILDWNDEHGDNLADLQVLVDYSGLDDRGLWKAHYMWFIDTDKDQLFNYIDWNTLIMEGWEHSGRAKFFLDYHGKSIFLKVHANTFNINDLEYNWENPFLFFDPDNDGQTEISIRYIDNPTIVKGLPPVKENENVNKIKRTVLFTKKITSVQMGFDLDNDSNPENELDFDMSIKFSGEGFDYSDQIHKYKSLRGLPEADKYFFDPRWRQLEELVYTDHEVGYQLPFKRGNWNECWLVLMKMMIVIDGNELNFIARKIYLKLVLNRVGSMIILKLMFQVIEDNGIWIFPVKANCILVGLMEEFTCMVLNGELGELIKMQNIIKVGKVGGVKIYNRKI